MASVIFIVACATAATAIGFDRFFGPSPGGGYGRISGDFNFTSIRTIDFRAVSDDICPGDGFGISMYFDLIMGPDNAVDRSGYKAVNKSGCGTAAVEDGQVYKARQIRNARVIGCYTNDGSLCAFVDPASIGVRRDNPYN